jgi:type II secretory pathway component PulF
MRNPDPQPLGQRLETGISRSPAPVPDDNDVSVQHDEENLRDLRRSVWGVTLVRLAVHGLLFAVLGTGLLVVVSRVRKIFEDFQVKLPMTTELVIGIGDAVLQVVFLVPPVLAVVLAIDGAILYYLQYNGQRWLARIWFFLVLLFVLAIVAGAAVALFVPFIELTEGLSQ